MTLVTKSRCGERVGSPLVSASGYNFYLIDRSGQSSYREVLSSKERPRPQLTLLLTEHLMPGWLLREPIVLTIVEDSDGSFVATDDITTVYGVGDTAIEAYSDYIDSLAEYYLLLESDAADNPGTASQLHLLQRHLARE